MSKMNFVKNISISDLERLKIIENSKTESMRTRNRAQVIRLSYLRYTLTQLSEIFEVHKDTVGIWIHKWNTEKFNGLRDKLGKGRKTIIHESEYTQILKFVKQSPQQIKTVLQQIEDHFQRSISAKTLKRILKKINFHGNEPENH
jgi:transposase